MLGVVVDVPITKTVFVDIARKDTQHRKTRRNGLLELIWQHDVGQDKHGGWAFSPVDTFDVPVGL